MLSQAISSGSTMNLDQGEQSRMGKIATKIQNPEQKPFA